MSGLYLPASLGPLTKLAAADVGRYSMCGVRLRDPGDGTFEAVVTDGRRLLAARGYCPERGRLNGQPGHAVVVPTEAWNELFRKPVKNSAGKFLPVTVEACKDEQGIADYLTLRTFDTERAVRAVEGRFPDWTQIVPKPAPVFSIAVNPFLLSELLLTIGKMLDEETRRVVLSFFRPDTPMAVVAKNKETGLCLDGLLMPLT